MYFLKKLSNFNKKANENEDANEAAAPASATCEESLECDEVGEETVCDQKSEEQKSRRNSPGSSLSIPDCFFDSVPETSSSASTRSSFGDRENDARERSSITPADVFGDRSEIVVDDSPQHATSAKLLPYGTFDIVESSNPSKETEIADLMHFFYDDDNIDDGGSGIIEDDNVATDRALGTSEEIRGNASVHSASADCGAACEAADSSASDAGEADSYVEDVSEIDGKVVRSAPFRVNTCNDDLSSNNCVQDNTLSESYTIESYLDQENGRAEARLAARRQARVEAREIRLRELERQQKEQEENADRAFDMSYGGDAILRTGRATPSSTILNPRDRSLGTSNSYHSSRRSSEDSIEEGLTLRDIRHELKEAEEKFKKAMIANAQLDNEKSALAYQVELLKDRYEDLEETHAQLGREHRDKCREHEQLKRAAIKLKEDLDFYKTNLLERDKLISEYGLVIVDCDEDGNGIPKRTLVSVQSAELLQQAGCGTLDVRLKKFLDERNEFLDEIRHLKLELEEEKNKRMSDSKSGYNSLSNGPLDEETSKILSDYKFKLQKAEQDVSTLQANVARLESQVIRYKTAAESSEKAEDELKIERRKLQRENRESIARIEELETANSHLQRRMDKLKNAKSTLLKEL